MDLSTIGFQNHILGPVTQGEILKLGVLDVGFKPYIP